MSRAAKVPRDRMLTFIREHASEARRDEQRRHDSAATWRSGTDAEWREGKRLSELMEGRKFKPSTSDTTAGREQNAQIDERIAAALEHDDEQLLKQIVIAWDADQDEEFVEAIAAARKRLGFKLADEAESA